MITVRERATIVTKDISFDLSNIENSKSLQHFTETFDNVPLLFLSKKSTTFSALDMNGTTIEPHDIVYVKLFNSKILPEIEVCCYETTGVFFTDLFPFEHDTVLSIFVKSVSKEFYPIRMDFRVTEFEVNKNTGDENGIYKYTIRGILDVDEIFYTNYESFKDMTSYDVLKKITTGMGLGFASNIEATDDKMTWINPSNTYIDFIKDTVSRGWVSDNSFVWGFIDFYYNFNYIDIQKEISDRPKELETINSVIIDKKESDLVNQYLSNNPALKTTNKFIEKFDLLNQAFKVNLDKSYKLRATWFNSTNATIHREFLNDLSTTDTNIIPLYDYDSEIYKEYRNDDWILVKVIEGNNHINYAKALKQNEFNLENIQKIKLVATLNQVNFSIKRFQNIKVEIYNVDALFGKNITKKLALNNINEKLSGYWLVTGINYIYRRTGGVNQEITLSRRDLNLTYKEQEDIGKIIQNNK